MADGVRRPKRENKPGEVKLHVSRETVSIPAPPGIEPLRNKQRAKNISLVGVTRPGTCSNGVKCL